MIKLLNLIQPIKLSNSRRVNIRCILAEFLAKHNKLDQSLIIFDEVIN